jgi:hypothetical protein
VDNDSENELDEIIYQNISTHKLATSYHKALKYKQQNEELHRALNALRIAWERDVADLERYGDAVYAATGHMYTGSADPTEPGPDPVDFDVFEIRRMGEEIRTLRKQLAELQTCPNCGLQYTGIEAEKPCA